MSVSVVTLCYNKYLMTYDFLLRLQTHEAENIDEVIVLNNGSTDSDVRHGLFKFEEAWPVLRSIHVKENLGFTLGANMALQQAKGDLVFLISNDVKISGKFIEQTKEIFADGRNYLVGHKMISWDSGWNTFNGKIYGYLEGYFLAAKNTGWSEIGYFDANYAPYDYEDVDLSTTAKKKGYKLIPLNIPTITHQGGGTIGYNPEREAITRRNLEYFKNKWVR